MKKAEEYQKIKSLMYDIAVEVNEMRGCYKPFPQREHFDLVINIEKRNESGEVVALEWETDAGCGDYDSHMFDYPAEYLDDNNWREKETIAIAKRKEIAEEAEKAKRKKLMENKKNAELKELKRILERKKELEKKYKVE